MTTKERIIETSRIVFNELGFGEPTLYQISQRMGISRGNLTYYFKDKETLLEALAEEMWEKYKAGVSETQFPSWENTYNSIKKFHQLQKEYAFIFFDWQILGLPLIKKQLNRIREDDIKRQMSIITFSIQIGNMRQEYIPGMYHNMCRTLWSLSFYWLLSKTYETDKGETGWDKIAWSMILPHFTEKGIESFIKHFGKEYYDALGVLYEDYVHQHISF